MVQGLTSLQANGKDVSVGSPRRARLQVLELCRELLVTRRLFLKMRTMDQCLLAHLLLVEGDNSLLLTQGYLLDRTSNKEAQSLLCPLQCLLQLVEEE